MKQKRMKLFEARKRKALTQEELARLAGISRAFYTNVENGVYDPSWTVIQRICDVLGESPDIFLDHDVRKESKNAS